MLRIEGLNQFYGGSHVLRDISLEVPTGQVTGVITELPSVAELMARIITEANATLARLG